MARRLTWCEVSTTALAHNLREFRRVLSPGSMLAPVVKANAYGHGMILAATTLEAAGADALCVSDVWEAEELRRNGIGLPVLVVGYTPPEAALDAVRARAMVTVYDEATLQALGKAAKATGLCCRVLVKLETGTNRQGVGVDGALRLAAMARSLDGVEFYGLSSHFADIEDTTDHTFARSQMARFQEAVKRFEEYGLRPRVRSVANSAATILWPETHMELARVGIAIYGMWPSKETFATAALSGRHRLNLRPVLSWKTIVAQVKDIQPGEFVGYGRTYRATHVSKLAVLPVGYYDGYDRKFSNVAYVLIRGHRAQVRGRVCMNMTMVDVTDIPDVHPGERVTLLGSDGADRVTAEDMAAWANTINYEVTTRISESIERIPVEDPP